MGEAVVKAAVLTGVAVFGGAPLIGGSALSTFGVNFFLLYASQTLSESAARRAARSFAAEKQGRTIVFRASSAPRQVVYGEDVVSGPLLFAGASGPDDRYLHLVIALAGHEVEAIDEIYFNDRAASEWDDLHRQHTVEVEWVPSISVTYDVTIDGTLYTDATPEELAAQIDALSDYSAEYGEEIRRGDVVRERVTIVRDEPGVTFSASSSEGVIKIAVEGELMYRVSKYTGTAAQEADPDLVAAVDEWSTDHRLRGIAYVVVTLTWDPDAWPTGVPNIKCRVRGKNDVYDPRGPSTGWSDNAALCALDYLRWQYGLDAAGEVDEASWIAAANVCDETVFAKPATSISASLAGGIVVSPAHGLRDGDDVVIAGHSNPGLNGTWTDIAVINHGTFIVSGSAAGTGGTVQLQQRRYTCNGAFDMDKSPVEVLESLLSSLAGAAVWQNGTWRGYAGAAVAPVTPGLTESDLRGPIEYRPRPGRAQRFNAVRGTYVNRHDHDQPTDFPPVTNSTYEAEDNGERVYRDVELSFTNDPYRAQRLAKIELERARQGIVCVFPAKISALPRTVWDVVPVSIDLLGWVDKPFQVVSWKLVEGGVDLVLQEYAAASYDWADGEATLVDPAPDTSLPSPLTPPAAPGAPQVTEELYSTRNGGGVKARALLEWSASQSAFVDGYEVEHKREELLDWTALPRTRERRSEILDVEPGVYSIRVRAVNALGVRGPYATTMQEIYGLGAPPAMPANLSIAAVSSLALLSWDRHPDLDVRQGGRYRFRHSPASSGAQWQNAVAIGESVPGESTVAVLPLLAGTYLMRAYDSSGVASDVATVVTNAPQLLAFAAVDTLQAHPLWLGTHDGTVNDMGSLKLVGAGDFDAIADFDAVTNLDGEGGVVAEGTYTFASGVDLGGLDDVRVTATLQVLVFNLLDAIDDRTALIDSWSDFDGSAGADAEAIVEVRTTEDDPTGSPTWGAWQRLTAGDYRAWGMEFRVRLSTSDPAYNVRVDALTVNIEEVA